MLAFPNCKINLGLFVTDKRTDGYHDLETVFYPLALRDVLEIVPANKERAIHLSGKPVAGDHQANLVWRAYELLRNKFPEKVPALDIFLHKNIPMGAGLGGGSADGAFMLRLINDFCRLHLGQDELARYALELGSDCPFFIYNTPVFAKGRGEIMEAIALDLSEYSIQLICPDVHVSTAQAFKMLEPKPSSFDLRMLASLPIAEWKNKVTNDFEDPVFEMHPRLKVIKQQLYEQGAIYASMSGSGSTIYGIFEKGRKAEIAVEPNFDSYVIPYGTS